jgi:hypothetical protein
MKKTSSSSRFVRHFVHLLVELGLMSSARSLVSNA